MSQKDTSCGRCRRCHPGKQFGGDSFCRNPDCGCHTMSRDVPMTLRDMLGPIPGVRRGGMELHNQATYDGWGSE